MCANAGAMIGISTQRPYYYHTEETPEKMCRDFLLSNSEKSIKFSHFTKGTYFYVLDEQYTKIKNIFSRNINAPKSVEQEIEIMREMLIKYIENRGEVDSIVKPYIWLISFPLVNKHTSSVISEALQAANCWNEMALNQSRFKRTIQNINFETVRNFDYTASALDRSVTTFQTAPNVETCEIVKHLFSKLTDLLPPTKRENPCKLFPDSFRTCESDFSNALIYNKYVDYCWIKLLFFSPQTI